MNQLNAHVGEKPGFDSPLFLACHPCGHPMHFSGNTLSSMGAQQPTLICSDAGFVFWCCCKKERCRLCWKWDLPLFSKALLNESSKPAGIGWAGEHPRDCLAEAARPRFIHRKVGMLASPFIHTHRISFTFCSFASRF